MRAIFIGGPLHGETKIVEPSHTRCVWQPPPNRLCGETEMAAEVVTYHRRWSLGDVAIFSIDGSDYDKLLVEAVERGLQVSPEPPLEYAVRYILRHANFRDVAEGEVEQMLHRVRTVWQAYQECSTVRNRNRK